MAESRDSNLECQNDKNHRIALDKIKMVRTAEITTKVIEMSGRASEAKLTNLRNASGNRNAKSDQNHLDARVQPEKDGYLERAN